MEPTTQLQFESCLGGIPAMMKETGIPAFFDYLRLAVVNFLDGIVLGNFFVSVHYEAIISFFLFDLTFLQFKLQLNNA